MSHTIDLMEQQFRRTMDWKTRVRENPLPYIAGGVLVLYLLVGGPRRTAEFIRSRRPRPKTKLEQLIEQLPDPIADRLRPPVHQAVTNIQDVLTDVPENLRKLVRDAQKERDKQLQKEEEERLKRAARATMWERLLTKGAEAAGAAAAAAAVKILTDRLLREPKD